MGSLEKMRYMVFRHKMMRKMEHGLGRGCGPRLYAACLLIAVLILLCGCKTLKTGIDEKTDTSDSVRIEYREKIVKVPVTVYVEVPAEKKERETRDTVSHLATRYADSWAKLLWRDGEPLLFHSLANIPQKIEKQDTVPVVEKERTVWRTRRVAYTKTVVRERRLVWWQKGLMWLAALESLIIILFVIIKSIQRIFLKP